MPDKTILLATDLQQSVLSAFKMDQAHYIAHTPYGHRPRSSGLISQIGFNGEMSDPVTGHYHLGNGYRQYNPVLMRFNSPDSWSPFGAGGVNAYMYCAGEPINRQDPSGHRFFGMFGRSLSPRRIQRDRDFLTPIFENLSGRVLMSGGREALHPQTISSMESALAKYGGARRLQSRALRWGQSPEELVIYRMREMQYKKISKNPSKKQLDCLSPKERAKRISRAELKINEISNELQVLTDIMDGAGPDVSRDARGVWENRMILHNDKADLLKDLGGRAPPYESLTFEPPPTFDEAMHIRRQI